LPAEPAIYCGMNTHQESPASIMPAATVILTREYAGKFQIYLLNRNILDEFLKKYMLDQLVRLKI